MTKADIINEITKQTGVSKKEVTTVVESFMECVKGSLLRAAKTARNISKNTTITIAAHDLPSFKPAKSFIEQMK